MSVLSTFAERRPERNERDRANLANEAAAHLPISVPHHVSEADMVALKLAHMRRFDEDLPRTETLLAVANIGYRMALRDLAANKGERPQPRETQI